MWGEPCRKPRACFEPLAKLRPRLRPREAAPAAPRCLPHLGITSRLWRECQRRADLPFDSFRLSPPPNDQLWPGSSNVGGINAFIDTSWRAQDNRRRVVPRHRPRQPPVLRAAAGAAPARVYAQFAGSPGRTGSYQFLCSRTMPHPVVLSYMLENRDHAWLCPECSTSLRCGRSHISPASRSLFSVSPPRAHNPVCLLLTRPFQLGLLRAQLPRRQYVIELVRGMTWK